MPDYIWKKVYQSQEDKRDGQRRIIEYEIVVHVPWNIWSMSGRLEHGGN